MHVFPKVKDNLHTLEFNLTKNCNYACTYCFVDQSLKYDMSYDLIKDIMDSYKVEDRKYNIVFFGGEPLLKANEIIRFIKEYTDIVTNFSILTNGSLLTKEMLDEFKPYSKKLNIQISLDGPKEVHDKYRIYKNGEGTFDDSMRGAYLLTETEYVNWSFHASCSEYHIKYLYDIYSIMYKHSPQHIRKDIYHNMQIIHDCDSYNETTLENFKEQITRMLTDYPNLKDELKKTFYENRPNHVFCSAGRNYFSFFANGEIAPCHRFYTNPITNKPTIVGNFKTGEWYENIYTIFSNDNKNSFHGIEKCSNCNSAICYPCYLSNYNNTKDYFVSPVAYCWFKKETWKFLNEQLTS